MIKKKIFFLILFSWWLSAQNIENINLQNEFPKQMDEMNYLLDRIQSTFQKEVIEGNIPTDISFSKLVAYGFDEVQIEYIENILQEIFLEKIGFRLIKIDELFNSRVVPNQKTQRSNRIKGPKSNQEYYEIAKKQGNENFIEFYFYRFKNSILIRAFIHDAKSTEVIWFKRWSFETRSSDFVFYIDYNINLISIPFQLNIGNVKFIDSYRGGSFFPNTLNKAFLGFFLGSRQVGFGDYGVQINLGYSYNGFSRILTHFFIGPKIKLNLFELSKMDKYYRLNLYFTFDAGLFLQSLIIPMVSSSQYFPVTSISSSLGLLLVFDSIITLGVSFDYVQFDLNLKLGLKF